MQQLNLQKTLKSNFAQIRFLLKKNPAIAYKEIIEIGKKVNEDFDKKKLPLMLSMIDTITHDIKFELNWELFR